MSKYTARELRNHETACNDPKHGWIPARPINYRYEPLWLKLKHAWGVFTGRYDVVDWEDQTHDR